MSNKINTVIKWTVKQVSNPLSSTPFFDIPFVSDHYFDTAKAALKFISEPANNKDNPTNTLFVIMNFMPYDENEASSTDKPEPILVQLSADENGKWVFPVEATYKKGNDVLPVPAFLINELNSCY